MASAVNNVAILAQSKPRLKFMLADDDPFILNCLERLIGKEFDVCAVIENGTDVCAAAESSQPDVILIDLHLRGLDTAKAIGRIHSRLPTTKIVVITGGGSNDEYIDVLAHGAAAVFLKTDLCAAALRNFADQMHQSSLKKSEF